LIHYHAHAQNDTPIHVGTGHRSPTKIGKANGALSEVEKGKATFATNVALDQDHLNTNVLARASINIVATHQNVRV
jgi:hypothetical protein